MGYIHHCGSIAGSTALFGQYRNTRTGMHSACAYGWTFAQELMFFVHTLDLNN